jgi:hypothetical protein
LLAVGLLLGAPAGLSTACAVHGVTLIAMTAAEPGVLRLQVGAGVAGVAGLAALGVLAWGLAPTVEPRVVLHDDVAGFTLTLPPGWKRAEELDVAPHLVLPWDGGKTVNYAFRLDSPRQVGVLIISRDEQPALDEACRDALAKLGVTTALPPLDGPPPPSFGDVSRVSELKTRSGALGRFGCALVGTKLVALAVVSQDPAPGVGAAAFERVAGGLSVQP